MPFSIEEMTMLDWITIGLGVFGSIGTAIKILEYLGKKPKLSVEVINPRHYTQSAEGEEHFTCFNVYLKVSNNGNKLGSIKKFELNIGDETLEPTFGWMTYTQTIHEERIISVKSGDTVDKSIRFYTSKLLDDEEIKCKLTLTDGRGKKIKKSFVSKKEK